MARAIDADKAIEVAQIKYNDWNLAMAAADGRREINLCFKKQELFKAVKAVLDCVPTLTPPNEWVSVDERLPEMNKPVLVYCDGGFAVSYIFDTDMLTGNPVWNYTGLGGDPWYWTTIPTPPDRRPPEGEV